MGRLLRLAVSAGLLALAVWLMDWDGVRKALGALDGTSFVIAVALLACEFPVLGLRWFLMIRNLAPLPATEHLRRYLMAVFLNTFTPGQLGGDVYRFVDLRRNGASGARLAARLVQERALGLIGYLAFFDLCLLIHLASAAAPWSGLNSALALAGAGFATVVLAAPFVAPLLLRVPLSARWRQTSLVSRAHALLADSVDFGTPGNYARLVGLSMIGGGLIWTVGVWVVARGIGMPASFAILGMTAVVVDIVRLVPVTIQGIGVREAGFALVLGWFGYDVEQAFILGAVVYAAVGVATLAAGALGRLMPPLAGAGQGDP